MRYEPRPADRGFTLIELLVVILVVGILAAVGLASFLGQTDKAKNSEMTQQLSVAYRQVKADAASRDGAFAAPAQIKTQVIDRGEPGMSARFKGPVAGSSMLGPGEIAACTNSTAATLRLVGVSHSQTPFTAVSGPTGTRIARGDCTGPDSTASYSSDLVASLYPTPSFEAATWTSYDEWTSTAVATLESDGPVDGDHYAAVMRPGGGRVGINLGRRDLDRGERYQLSAYARTSGPARNVELYVDHYVGASWSGVTANRTVGPDWTRVSLTFTVPANSDPTRGSNPYVWAYGTSAGEKVFFDAVRLRRL